MKKIGVVYLSNESFLDEANQTIGKPALDATTIINRRLVTSRLTDAGKRTLQQVIGRFKKDFNLDVKLSWSRFAGCSCPCSPGFTIRTEANLPFGIRSDRDGYELNVFGREDGSFEFRYAKFGALRDPEIVHAENYAYELRKVLAGVAS